MVYGEDDYAGATIETVDEDLGRYFAELAFLQITHRPPRRVSMSTPFTLVELTYFGLPHSARCSAEMAQCTDGGESCR